MVFHTLDAITGTEIHDMTFLISVDYLDLRESLRFYKNRIALPKLMLFPLSLKYLSVT